MTVVRIMVDGKPKATLSVDAAGRIAATGADPVTALDLARHYAEQFVEEDGRDEATVTADEVLGRMLERCRGTRTWAEAGETSEAASP